MRLRLIDAPAEKPVSLEEVRSYLRADDGDSDEALGALLDAAIGRVDGRHGVLGRALCEQTWELLLDAFPAGDVTVPLPPLKEVLSISYLDAAGAMQTVSSASYIVDAASEPGVIALKPGQTWPATLAQRNAVAVQFKAGYGAAAAVPANLKAAIKLIAGDLYANREAQGGVLHENEGVSALLVPYRIFAP
ncbi:hypothetical protein ACHZ97_14330 [Lysobacter soli]|uniref:head-tail connector protein n=1 Tax=Lysobacter soli TaxID=453783 RepID=UPI0037CAEC74